jgi:PAS domain-containing protein
MATTQHDLVLIMAREFASRLATPVFLVNPEDDLLYFNEAAEEVLGFPFQEGRAIPVDEWTRDIVTLDEDGSELPRDERPLSVALGQRVPTHRRIRLATPRGDVRPTEVTAFPLFAHSDVCVGAMSIFWEPPEAGAKAP